MVLSNAVIADCLRHIPQSNHAPKALCDIHPACQSDDACQVLFGVVWMLSVWGIVKLSVHTDVGQTLIQASSQTAKYTLMSIADYVERDAQIVTDWQTRGMQDNVLGNGATFLHALEQERLRRFDHCTPSRHVKVAQVLIKRMNPETGDHELLFQFDHNANQYQLIGGRWSEKDGDDLTVTIVREIEEELPLNTLAYPQSYNLTLLLESFDIGHIMSPTFGALSHYAFWFYHMTDLTTDLKLQADDKWVPLQMILEGVVSHEGRMYPFANPDIFQRIDAALPDGLHGLSLSSANP
jgi:hypothetical protein